MNTKKKQQQNLIRVVACKEENKKVKMYDVVLAMLTFSYCVLLTHAKKSARRRIIYSI